MKLLIVAAVEAEIAGLLLPSRTETCITGIGPVEAAIAVTRALAHSSCDIVINLGIAGSFGPPANPGTSVLVTEEYYIDIGREDNSPVQLPPRVQLVDHIEIAPDLHQRLRHIVTLRGSGITSATITTSDARARSLRTVVPSSITESMEGFAVMRAASIVGIPALQIRGISNLVGDRAQATWNMRAGITASHALAKDVFDSLC